MHATDALPSEWLRCRDWIEIARAKADPLTPPAEVARQLFAGEAQLWPAPHGAIVTQVVRYRGVKVINFWLIGADRGHGLREMIRLLPTIEDYARSEGCTHACGSGSHAWARAIKRLGFQEGHTTFEKEL